MTTRAVPSCPLPFPPSPRRMCPTCRRSPACASAPRRPASATRTAPTCCWCCSPRHHRGRRVHPQRSARRAGRLVPRRARRRQGARRGGQRRQCQRLHRQGRAARPSTPPRGAAQVVGCPAKQVFVASTGVIGEVLPPRSFAAAAGLSPTRPAGRRLGGGGRGIMTTDTFPKAATRTARSARRRVTDHRHRQGQRHDRARHGDDAVLRLHRREAAGRRAAGDAEEGRRQAASTAHGRRRHLDLGHGAAVRHRPGAAPRVPAERAPPIRG